MNLGGPSSQEKVFPFLHNLFSDPDLIPIPFQNYLAPLIARRRTAKIQAQYAKIGGGSPIEKWTRIQAESVVKRLDQLSPSTAPHKAYIAFRYTEPSTETSLREMASDGIERAVAFTQYPQFSCSTTGSSLNELKRCLNKVSSSSIKHWSLIDRWYSYDGLVKSFAHLIRKKKPEKDVVLMFSAHSLPMSVVNRGDNYPGEVAATVEGVMKELNHSNPYVIVWQSQVGPSAWLGPKTENAIEGLAKKGHRKVMLVPIAFTSDHIETLYELDIEYQHKAKEVGIEYSRCDSLNDEPIFLEAMADLVNSHLKGNTPVSTRRYEIQCPGCLKRTCKETREFFLSAK